MYIVCKAEATFSQIQEYQNLNVGERNLAKFYYRFTNSLLYSDSCLDVYNFF